MLVTRGFIRLIYLFISLSRRCVKVSEEAGDRVICYGEIFWCEQRAGLPAPVLYALFMALPSAASPFICLPKGSRRK